MRTSSPLIIEDSHHSSPNHQHQSLASPREPFLVFVDDAAHPGARPGRRKLERDGDRREDEDEDHGADEDPRHHVADFLAVALDGSAGRDHRPGRLTGPRGTDPPGA